MVHPSYGSIGWPDEVRWYVATSVVAPEGVDEDVVDIGAPYVGDVLAR